METSERVQHLAPWAKSLVDAKAVTLDKGSDGFGTVDRVNYHFVHEVVFFASLNKQVLDAKEIHARTQAIQATLNVPQSKESAVRSHLNSMKKCVSVSAKHKLPADSTTNWTGMFGDRTDGRTILVSSNIPYWLRADLFEKYRQRKVERGESLSAGQLPSVLSVHAITSPPSVVFSTKEFTPDELVAETELEDSWAWVKQRRKQSKFRELAIENFDGVCCLTGVTNQDLLVAAHIVRWADDPEERLKPENGLLLYHEYDLLFENGYFYFDDNLTVCLPKWVEECGSFVRERLHQIKGRSILGKAKKWPTKVEYLRRHRERVTQLHGPSE